MKKSLFERIIEQFMQNPYFADFKFKKSESMLYVPTSDGMYFVEFEHWIDYGELVIYTYYGRRFEILTKWFEKYSFKTLRDQRNNPNIMCDNTFFGLEEYLYFDRERLDNSQEISIMIQTTKKNFESFAEKYATLEDFYQNDVLPIINDSIELPDHGADWVFIYLTLGLLVDKDNYSLLKKKILDRVEWMHSRNEPNIEYYYDKMDEIVSYMEKNVSLMNNRLGNRRD